MISENTQILDNNVASDWTKKALVDRLEENREEILSDGNYEQVFQEIHTNLVEWLKKAKQLNDLITEFEREVLNADRTLKMQQYLAHSKDKEGNEIETFNIFKFAAEIENRGEDIFGKTTDQFFLDGYKLVMAIRTFFTGEPIKYTVGISGSSGGEDVFYERTITAKELFEDTGAVSFTSNLYRTIPLAQGTLEEGKLSLKIFTLRINATQKRYGMVGDEKEAARMNTNLMKSLMRYGNTTFGENKINRGVVFEVYENFIRRYDELFNQSRKGQSRTQKRRAFEYLTDVERATKDFPGFYDFNKNPPFGSRFQTNLDMLYNDAIKNNLRFSKGGDIGLEQLKFNNAKLFNDVTILIKIIENLEKSFGNNNLKELKNTIIEEFTAGIEGDKYLTSEIDKKANEEAVKGINKVFRQIGVR